MRVFKRVDSFEVASRGTVITTKADKEMDRDNPDVIGEVVLIDDDRYMVRGVERFMGPTGMIRKDEMIGLLV